MFSKTCEYAIRAMIFIAKKSDSESKVGVKEIARAISSPEHFIAKILQQLTARGLVESVKGPHGGFYINRKGKMVTLADVVRAIDGDTIFKGCALGLKICSDRKPCPVHNEYKSIRTQLCTMMSTPVADVTTDLKSLVSLRKPSAHLR